MAAPVVQLALPPVVATEDQKGRRFGHPGRVRKEAVDLGPQAAILDDDYVALLQVRFAGRAERQCAEVRDQRRVDRLRLIAPMRAAPRQALQEFDAVDIRRAAGRLAEAMRERVSQAAHTQG